MASTPPPHFTTPRRRGTTHATPTRHRRPRAIRRVRPDTTRTHARDRADEAVAPATDDAREIRSRRQMHGLVAGAARGGIATRVYPPCPRARARARARERVESARVFCMRANPRASGVCGDRARADRRIDRRMMRCDLSNVGFFLDGLEGILLYGARGVCVNSVVCVRRARGRASRRRTAGD